ncbi:MAG: hypothetical protein IJT71_02120 [Oscillospiraceae bacterium]|nr:hypothetical protein [Oscillospiraceae bacterium]
MPDQQEPKTYGAYIDDQWARMTQPNDPDALSHVIAAQSLWLQVPDAEAAAAKPDRAAIDGWAEKIAGTRAFARMMDDPQTAARVAARDAEGLMTDLHGELTGRERKAPAAPERELSAPEQAKKTAPEVPTL